ncbi:MAG: hypothetical protein EXS30_11925 [Pedosphaera sp.]|nr:hypothetical protein [Pedosphaera sp.]
MKLVKKPLLFFFGLAVVLVVISLFLPSSVHVERMLAIPAPPEKVFDQINTLKNWEKWSPWHQLDPNMKLQYDGAPSGIGTKYSWQSKQRNVGNGTLTITKSVPHSTIETAMHFDDGDGIGRFKLEKIRDTTQVTWSMDSDMGKNPIAKYVGLFMDKMVGPDFEKGLNNLKMVCDGK